MTRMEFTNDEVYARLRQAFACEVHDWPVIQEKRPRWWQVRKLLSENTVNVALMTVWAGPVDDEMRAIYWREIRKGQDLAEDAGGYLFRAWEAALELPYREATQTYRSMGLL